MRAERDLEDPEPEPEPEPFGRVEDSSDFHNLLQEAAKLKGCQLDEKRRVYLAAPKFMQDTLNASEVMKEARKAPFRNRLEKSTDWKGKGNELFKSGDYLEAIIAYSSAISVFRYFEDVGEDRFLRENSKDLCETDVAKVQALLGACFLNVAACSLKLSDPEATMYSCEQVLRMDADNIKAMYRRALAYAALETKEGSVYLDMAICDLKKVCSLDPQNKEARAALQKYTKLRVASESKDREAFGGMFGRGDLYDKDKESLGGQQDDLPPIPGAVKRDGMWYDGQTGNIMV